MFSTLLAVAGGNGFSMAFDSPLLVPDWNRRLPRFQQPSGRFAALWRRFRDRLESDPEFRRANIFLPALLGEPEAIAEAKALVQGSAHRFATSGAEDGAIEHHTWCTAPHVMRPAVYYDWLKCHGAWSPEESRRVGEGLLNFCYEHAVAVLRSRVPAGDNQSLSMALTCAVTGEAFREVPEVAERARALAEYGCDRVKNSLSLMPADGYSGEGATYQSHVVSPLVMWATAYLVQREGRGQVDLSPLFLETIRGPIENFRTYWEFLMGLLRVEGLMASPGRLLWPLDHYGWHYQSNLAALAAYASYSGDASVLDAAEEIWDRPTFIAWHRDDRMWTLLQWPEQDEPTHPVGLGGWSLPRTAAALDHYGDRSRLLLAWDASSPALQAITRLQVNPNHLAFERNGEPLFADGSPKDTGFLGVSAAEVAAPLSPEARTLLELQYGSLDKWLNGASMGLLGASNTLFPRGQEGYFPRHGARGRLFFEERNEQSHVVTAESEKYMASEWGLSRARRTVAALAEGVFWVVDDYRGGDPMEWVWQCYVRRDSRLAGECLFLEVPGAETTLAWSGPGLADLADCPGFPAKGDGELLSWPEDGSRRFRLNLPAAKNVVQAVCILPGILEGARVEATGEWSWRAVWPGGESHFQLPQGARAELGLKNLSDHQETWPDLDEEPFYLLDEPNEALISYVAQGKAEDWRLITRAIQTLAARGEGLGFPETLRILEVPGHIYQTRSVAAWYLGRARYAPALETLRKLRESPETNQAWRAKWGVMRIQESVD